MPDKLKERAQWVLWRKEQRGGKWTKVLYDPATGRRAKSNDQATWSTFDVTVGALKNNPTMEGIGYVFVEDDPFVGVDLDQCMDENGELLTWAREYVDLLDSYSERSQSKRGVHVIVEGTLPATGRRKGSVEMYSSGRFFAMTGDHLPGTPTTIEDRRGPLCQMHARVFGEPKAPREKTTTNTNGNRPHVPPAATLDISDHELLELARGARNGPAFRDLYDQGNLTRYDGDESAGDLALCNLLAFWCQGDASRVDRLFQGSALYQREGRREKWHSARGTGTYGSLTVAKAIADCREFYSGPGIEVTVGDRSTGATNGAGPAAPSNRFRDTDEGNAERLVARHGKVLRYCFERDQWLIWNSVYWEPDRSNQIEHYAVDTARAMLAEAAKTEDKEERETLRKQSKVAESKRGMRSMIDLAQKHVAVLPAALDRNPWLITVPNGTIDLRTGKLRQASQDDLITVCLSTEYDPAAVCPIWNAYLERVLPHPEVRSYVQRCAGYSLTGSVREQVFFFLWGCGRKPNGQPGDGNNGKSTFLETLYTLFGDYARKTDVNVFRKADHDAEKPRPELSKMRGRRFVTASEMPDDFEINEALIKDLTGLDTISARDVYSASENFKATFKVWMYGNYKPVITGTNEGIKRRPKLIHFPAYIAPTERDKGLLEKLEGEMPGILGWCIAGAIDWYKRGSLQEPDEVTEATKEYLEDMDPMGQFFEQECEFGLTDEYVVTKDMIYSTYRSWCWDRGDVAASDKALGHRLKQVGIRSFRSSSVMKYRGIKLAPRNSGG